MTSSVGRAGRSTAGESGNLQADAQTARHKYGGYRRKPLVSVANNADISRRAAFDLTLTDCQMPDIDSTKTARQIRERQSRGEQHTA
jgi:CheY-like chemotaxis protein